MRTDDDEIFDENGILRDGKSARVKMTMRDSALRRRRMMTDASFVTDGTDDPTGMHRPGYRVQLADEIAFVTKQEARRQYLDTLTSAWRDPDGNGAGSTAFLGAQEGDACMTDDRRPGHMQMRGGKLVCMPDRSLRGDSRLQDSRQAALRDYDRQVSEMWKVGR